VLKGGFGNIKEHVQHHGEMIVASLHVQGEHVQHVVNMVLIISGVVLLSIPHIVGIVI